MKKIFLFFIIIIYSCDRYGKEGDCGEPFKLSLREHTFNAKGGSIDVNTKNSFWIIDLLDINDHENSYSIWGLCEKVDYDYPFEIGCAVLSNVGLEVTTLKNEWFSITKKNLQKLTIEFQPNDTKQTRWIYLHLVDGDCGESVKITQSAEE